MKITVIGMVKNAADIIESFIRCNSTFADNYVLLNNMSTDRTCEILSSLKEEGFDIEIIEDKESGYHQSEKMNRLLRYTIDKYGSDVVVPLDDDEILYAVDGCKKTTRQVLEEISKNELHYTHWRMYIPTEYDDINELSVALRMRYRMDDQLRTSPKIVIPNQIVDESFKIAQGNHYASGDLIMDYALLNELKIAHYPVRSAEQIKSKALVGWTNYLLMPDRKPSNGFQWKAIYEHIKNSGNISMNSLQMMTLSYYEELDESKINIICDTINLPEECFKTLYTRKNEINAMKNYMTHVESIIAN